MYISQLLNNKVRDSADVTVGRLKDILIKPGSRDYPALLFLYIKRASDGQFVYVPYDYVANLSREEISLKNLWKNIPPVTTEPEGVLLNRGVMDEQIVDVEGARVVRVNDLKLGLFENKMCVLGIDVSFKGILRRLLIDGLDFFDIFKVNLIDWRKAQLVKGVLQLNTISKDLTRLHPADLANIIEDLSIKQGSNLVRSLDSASAAQVVEEMEPEIQKLMIHYLGPERAAEIVDRMSTDEAVDLLQLLPKQEAKKFLSYLQGSKTKKMEKLIQYPDDTAGGLMTVEYMSARPEWTVLQTIEEVKKVSPHLRSLLYIYVTDDKGVLHGAISLRSILLARGEDQLKSIVKPLRKNSVLKVEYRIDKIIKIMTRYDLYTAAVVDHKHRMVGMLTIDDVMRHLVPNA